MNQKKFVSKIVRAIIFDGIIKFEDIKCIAIWCKKKANKSKSLGC